MKYAMFLLLLFCLPAHAEVWRVMDTQTGRIMLHDTAGQCVGKALFAEYISADGSERIGGCYLSTATAVRVVFLDGDVVVLPVAELRKSKMT